ncbi:hypothetical protein ACFQ0T_34045 [Kitasatospora gansuensis]
MRILRKLAIAATALALAAPVALAPTAQASAPVTQGADQRASRIYISPGAAPRSGSVTPPRRG